MITLLVAEKNVIGGMQVSNLIVKILILFERSKITFDTLGETVLEHPHNIKHSIRHLSFA